MRISQIPAAALRRAGRAGVHAIAAAGAAGLAAGAWGLLETQLFTLRRRTLALPGVDVDELPSSTELEPETLESDRVLRILHLSDLHLLAHQSRKRAWVAELAATKPDFVVLTGDLMAEAKALEAALEALEPFLSVPGAYVFGSNDYRAPRFKNPLSYIGLTDGISEESTKKTPELPWREVDATFREAGWLNLTNTRASAQVKNWSLDLVGVDDPHIARDIYPERTVPALEGALRIGVTHAPYARILDRMTAEGCDLVFAGHTHGGQLCLPFAGALVTNCDLPRSHASGMFLWPSTGELPIRRDATVRTDHRPTAIGLSTFEQRSYRRYASAEKELRRFLAEDGTAQRHGTWVNVSAGLGQSPFAPARIACRPEAILIDVLRP